MAKRQRTNRASPSTYIPYGKPEEVVVERVDYGNGKRDRRRGVEPIRYVERLSGVSLDSRTAHDTPKVKDTGLIHVNGCKGQKGVARLFWRGGEGWCEKDYEIRWDESPWFDDKLEDAPRDKR